MSEQEPHASTTTSTTSPETPKSKKDFLLQFFTHGHLPPNLAEISALYTELAKKLDEVLPMNPERTVAFRKLLESKDCAVRCVKAAE